MGSRSIVPAIVMNCAAAGSENGDLLAAVLRSLLAYYDSLRTKGCGDRSASLARLPITLRRAAGGSFALKALTIAIRNHPEVAAKSATVPVLPRAGKRAVVVAMLPLVVTADVAVQAMAIGVVGVALVVATNVT